MKSKCQHSLERNEADPKGSVSTNCLLKEKVSEGKLEVPVFILFIRNFLKISKSSFEAGTYYFG